MLWNNYTALFLIFFLLGTFIETGLDLLQERYLRRRGNRVPEQLKGRVSEESIAKAIAYNLHRVRFRLVVRILEAAVLWLFIVSGFAMIDALVRGFSMGPVISGVLLCGLIAAVAGILRLPVDLYSVFVIEEKFGFNRQRLRGFFIDAAKSTAIGALLGGLLLTVILSVMEALREDWWIAGFIAVALIQLAMLWVYPLVIMPLFNRFTPVAEPLAGRIAALAEQVRFPLRGVVSMDGSKRSSHSNAFIIGVRGSRRIVLFDTLIEKLGADGLLAVLAHELGHYRLGHIRIRLMGMLVIMAGAFFLAGALSRDPALPQGLGFPVAGSCAALIATLLLLESVSFPLGFLSRWFSRRNEYAADRFAVDAVKNGTDLQDALIALSRQNLTSPGSHRLYRAWYNSHPALRERLAAISAWAKKRGYPEELRSAPDTPGDAG